MILWCAWVTSRNWRTAAWPQAKNTTPRGLSLSALMTVLVKSCESAACEFAAPALKVRAVLRSSTPCCAHAERPPPYGRISASSSRRDGPMLRRERRLEPFGAETIRPSHYHARGQGV